MVCGRAKFVIVDRVARFGGAGHRFSLHCYGDRYDGSVSPRWTETGAFGGSGMATTLQRRGRAGGEARLSFLILPGWDLSGATSRIAVFPANCDVVELRDQS
jgi:hypothetical protein